MDPIQYPFKSDHDVLVALITQFNNTAETISQSVNEDKRMTREVKQLLEDQYAAVNGRLTTLEENFKQLDPKGIAKLKEDTQRNTQWINDFNRAKHIAWVVASAGFMLIGYYIPFFFNAITSTIWNISHMK